MMAQDGTRALCFISFYLICGLASHGIAGGLGQLPGFAHDLEKGGAGEGR